MQRSHIESSMVIVKQKNKREGENKPKKKLRTKVGLYFFSRYFFHDMANRVSILLNVAHLQQQCSSYLLVWLVGDENIDNVCGWIDMYFDGMDFLDWVFYLCQELWREWKTKLARHGHDPIQFHLFYYACGSCLVVCVCCIIYLITN